MRAAFIYFSLCVTLVAACVPPATTQEDQQQPTTVPCELSFAASPLVSQLDGSVFVLNQSLDSDSQKAGYQGGVVVKTSPGVEIQVMATRSGQTEVELARGTTNEQGEIGLNIDMPDGQVSLYARCTLQGEDPVQTKEQAFVVDTQAPTCAVTSPSATTSITPALDTDQMLANGIQVQIIGHAEGSDAVNEPAQFALSGPAGTTTLLDAGTVGNDGNARASASFVPPSPPGEYEVRFSVNDHAGNKCQVTTTYRVAYEGCAIAVIAPTGTITTDADANQANGAQVDILVHVAEACAGRLVTSNCGSDDPSASAVAPGSTSLRATVCASAPCTASETCTVSVTSTDGIETSSSVGIVFDNQAPGISVGIAAPTGALCGATVVPADDIDGAVSGVQVRMRVDSPEATTRSLSLTTDSGTATQLVSSVDGELTVTLTGGPNDFVGFASDAVGNTAMTTTCRLTLADLAVGFMGAAADGLVGSLDGTVTDGVLAFTLAGTVTSGASVSVTVDGGAPATASVLGTSWTLPIVVAAQNSPHAVVATATQGDHVGIANLALTVDVSAPTAVASLTPTVIDRASIRVAFTAPNDNGAAASSYLVRYASVALSDVNFDSTGTLVSGPTPAAPGTPQFATVHQLRAGTPYWVALAVVDAAGNRSPAQVCGPITPEFDVSATYSAPNTTGNAGFGTAITRGHFNDDAFEDVAVSAPFVTSNGAVAAGEVYVFLGSATGLAASPALTLRGSAVGGQFGNALTRVRWSSATRDDLVVSAPFEQKIYVFNGGAALPAGTQNASSAQRQIQVSATSNWFTPSGLGWQVARADHNGDGVDDLVATAVFGGASANTSAAVVFYGGTIPTGAVAISDTSAAGSGSAVMHMYEIFDPNFAGLYLHNLGQTEGNADLTDDFAVGYSDDRVPAEVVIFRGTTGPLGSAGVTRVAFTSGRDVILRLVTADTTTGWGAMMGSIEDQNGDGARDIVIGAARDGTNAGRFMIIDGKTTGTAGLALTSDAGVVLADYQASGTSASFASAIVNNNHSVADIDGDGHEDLIVAKRGSTQAELNGWFGPLTLGTRVDPTPDFVITGPATFTGVLPASVDTALRAVWVDVNNDGLEDICWADWRGNSLDGSMQVLWDDGL